MSVTSEHYVLAEDEAEAIWFLGTLATIKASADRTGGALSVVEFTHPPGFAVPPRIHHEADEAFYTLEGAMRGFCGDRTWHATPGSLVWLPRGYAVDGDVTLRSLVINMPGGFERFVMEAGESAPERTMPPPAAPDVEKLDAAAAKVGIEHLGPPEQ
jgi:hypothetical protein